MVLVPRSSGTKIFASTSSKASHVVLRRPPTVGEVTADDDGVLGPYAEAPSAVLDLEYCGPCPKQNGLTPYHPSAPRSDRPPPSCRSADGRVLLVLRVLLQE